MEADEAARLAYRLNRARQYAVHKRLAVEAADAPEAKRRSVPLSSVELLRMMAKQSNERSEARGASAEPPSSPEAMRALDADNRSDSTFRSCEDGEDRWL